MTLMEQLNATHLDRLLLATVLGAIIGWEREQHGRPAGLRTHMLVCIGSAIMMLVSEFMFEKYRLLAEKGEGFVRVDPGRIAAQIITGIGFIGAGVIMKWGLRVQGLTTAACLWLTAGIGMAAGSGMHFLSIFSTGLAAFVLFYLGKLEKKIPRDIHKTLTLWAKGDRGVFEAVRAILKDLNITFSRYTFEDRLDKDIVIYTLNVKLRDQELLSAVGQAIREKIPNVTRLKWD